MEAVTSAKTTGPVLFRVPNALGAWSLRRRVDVVHCPACQALRPAFALGASCPLCAPSAS